MVRFTPELVSKIKIVIRRELSARHVPAVILKIQDIPVSFVCSDIPYTGIYW